jgi:hypothetical protein
MVDFLLESAWLGPSLWAGLYVSDYCLTIACARMYQAQDKVVFEGSYEITPIYQKDINALRRVSPRFLIALVLTTAYVVVVQRMSGVSPELYLGVLGAMLLAQATVHVRHLRNWFMFRHGTALMHGRLMYPRTFLLRMSAVELLLFAGLYLSLFLVTGSWFILGGAIASGVLAIGHYRLARRHDASLRKAA